MGNILSTGGQADWNQNDENAPDYVKNRPFYTGDPIQSELIREQTVTFEEDSGVFAAISPVNLGLVEGQTYTVKFDGQVYECVCKLLRNVVPYIGCASMFGMEDTGEPFMYFEAESPMWFAYNGGTEHTLSVMITEAQTVKLPEKYLPVATETSYGVVKKSETVTPYIFPSVFAPKDEMIEAVMAFRNGNASIVWNGSLVAGADYEESDESVTIIFANEPFLEGKYIPDKGEYNQTIGDVYYRGIRGGQILIGVPDQGNVTLSSSGEPSSLGLKIDAERIMFGATEALNRKELILTSSTNNSSKRFKITVDDNGALSTSEVAN